MLYVIESDCMYVVGMVPEAYSSSTFAIITTIAVQMLSFDFQLSFFQHDK